MIAGTRSREKRLGPEWVRFTQELIRSRTFAEAAKSADPPWESFGYPAAVNVTNGSFKILMEIRALEQQTLTVRITANNG